MRPGVHESVQLLRQKSSNSAIRSVDDCLKIFGDSQGRLHSFLNQGEIARRDCCRCSVLHAQGLGNHSFD